jgi:hypothetical protein
MIIKKRDNIFSFLCFSEIDDIIVVTTLVHISLAPPRTLEYMDVPHSL